MKFQYCVFIFLITLPGSEFCFANSCGESLARSLFPHLANPAVDYSIGFEPENQAYYSAIQEYGKVFDTGILRIALYDELIEHYTVDSNDLPLAILNFDNWPEPQQLDIVVGISERIAASIPTDLSISNIRKIREDADNFQMTAEEFIEFVKAWRLLTKNDPLMGHVRKAISVTLMNEKRLLAASLEKQASLIGRMSRSLHGPAKTQRNLSCDAIVDVRKLAIGETPFSADHWSLLQRLPAAAQLNYAMTYLNALSPGQLGWVLENVALPASYRHQIVARIEGLEALGSAIEKREALKGTQRKVLPLSEAELTVIQDRVKNIERIQNSKETHLAFEELLKRYHGRFSSAGLTKVIQAWMEEIGRMAMIETVAIGYEKIYEAVMSNPMTERDRHLIKYTMEKSSERFHAALQKQQIYKVTERNWKPTEPALTVFFEDDSDVRIGQLNMDIVQRANQIKTIQTKNFPNE